MKGYASAIVIFLKGMFMGAADVVPGISGGTIALITGVYQNFILSLSKILKAQSLRLILGLKLKEFFYHLNGPFFFPLVIGILTSIFLFAHIVSYVYIHFPIMLWSFFLGLVLAATFLLIFQVKKWNLKTILFLVLGIISAWLATGGVPLAQTHSLASIFVAGLIAVSAMLLPGISGSFLLILLGKYQVILEATKNLDWVIIFTFGAGCIVSLVIFSKLLSWLIKNYWDTSLSLLVGFLIGSMHKLWPWRETLTTYVSSSGEDKPLLQRNISPWLYQEINAMDSQFIWALLFAFLGIAIIVLLEFLKRRSS